MKLCRFQPQYVPPEKIGATIHPGVLQGVISGDVVREVSGEIFGKWTVTDRSWPLNDVKLLTPVVPSKIVCLGRNYLDHAAEFNNLPPKEPLIFLKPPSSLLAPEEPIVLPPNVQRIDFEGELAVIISRECHLLSDDDDVRPYIAGYTLLNDVSARDYQMATSQWMIGKTFDTFAPMGPAIVSADEIADPHNLDISLTINGETLQHSNTKNLIFQIPDLIEYLSAVFTLESGDVISTGTPAGVGFARKPPRFLKPGDDVVVRVEGLGELRNRVANEIG